MRALSRLRWLRATALALVALLAAAVPADAGLRIADLDVALTERGLTVDVALLDALGPPFQEGLQSGVPAHVRYTIELWQHHRYWPDSLLLTRVVERTLVYDVLTRQYRVTTLVGEARPPHVTRALDDAARVLSELRGLTLGPVATVEPAEVVYVRVRADASLNGQSSFVTRLAGSAEQATRQSGYRTLLRVP